VPTLYLSLGLRVARGAAHMAHFPGIDIFCQFTRYVAGAVIAE
jgi:hypothetical protein